MHANVPAKLDIIGRIRNLWLRNQSERIAQRKQRQTNCNHFLSQDFSRSHNIARFNCLSNVARKHSQPMLWLCRSLAISCNLRERRQSSIVASIERNWKSTLIRSYFFVISNKTCYEKKIKTKKESDFFYLLCVMWPIEKRQKYQFFPAVPKLVQRTLIL